MAITLGVNAYTTVTDFRTWADLRNHDHYGFIDSEVEAAIVVASVDFIDTTYTFRGTALESDQSMQLPTNFVSVADVNNAACQAVWQHLNGLLYVTQTADMASGEIKRVKSKLDALEKETEYQESTARGLTHNTAQIDRLIKPFVVNSGMAVLRG